MWRVKWINLNETLSKLLTHSANTEPIRDQRFGQPRSEIAYLYQPSSLLCGLFMYAQHSTLLLCLCLNCILNCNLWHSVSILIGAIWWFWFLTPDVSAIWLWCSLFAFCVFVPSCTCYIKVNYLSLWKWNLHTFLFKLISIGPKNSLLEEIVVLFLYLIRLAVNCPCDMERLND